MGITLFFSSYLIWHYSIGLADFFRVWGNFLWFDWHFFSIPLLTKTLVSPWRRLGETKKQPGLHPEEFFGNLIVNTLMRIVGIFVRLATIIIGLFFLVVIAIIGFLALIVWLTAPFIIPFLIASSVRLLFF